MEISSEMKNKLKKWGKIVLLIVSLLITWYVVFQGMMSLLSGLPGWLINIIPLYAGNTHVGIFGLAVLLTYGVFVLIHKFYTELTEKNKMILELEKRYKLLDVIKKDIEKLEEADPSNIDADLSLEDLYKLRDALRRIIDKQATKETCSAGKGPVS
jgi:hypothetical protein